MLVRNLPTEWILKDPSGSPVIISLPHFLLFVCRLVIVMLSLKRRGMYVLQTLHHSRLVKQGGRQVYQLVPREAFRTWGAAAPFERRS
jgi:hypothetical protein